jgi:hypothetical protein
VVSLYIRTNPSGPIYQPPNNPADPAYIPAGCLESARHGYNKKNFEQAKAAAIKWLDACPSEVIRKFINHSL